MREKIYHYIMEVVSENDMMEYTEFELEDLLKDTAKVIDNKSNLWVKEISDGKYELNIEHNNIHKSVEIKAWDSKEEFADAVYMLFVMPE